MHSNAVMVKYQNRLLRDMSKCDTNDSILKDAISPYLCRCVHYVLFDLQLTDPEVEKMCLVYELTNLKGFLRIGAMTVSTSQFLGAYESIVEIYKTSPVIRDWKEKKEFGELESSELIMIAQRILHVAALGGTFACLSALVHDGEFRVIPTDFKMPLEDREKLRLVILEFMRIKPPVTGATYISEEPLRCPYNSGKSEAVFPPGTPVVVNFGLYGRDPTRFKDPLKFDPYGRSKQLWGPDAVSISFNGFGDHGPRRCPGRDIGLEMITTVLQTLLRSRGTLHESSKSIDISGLIDAVGVADEIIAFVEGGDPLRGKLDAATSAWILITHKFVDSTVHAPPSKSVSNVKEKQQLSKTVQVLQPSEQHQPIIVPFATFCEEFGDCTKLDILENALVNAQDQERNELYFARSVQDCIQIGKDNLGHCLPESESFWSELESDTAFSALMFVGQYSDACIISFILFEKKKRDDSHKCSFSRTIYSAYNPSISLYLSIGVGIGMQYVESCSVKKGTKCELVEHLNPRFVVDLSFMHAYEVRKKFERYGATAYFSADKDPLAIWWDAGKKLVLPGESDWQHAKSVLKSTIITWMTAAAHLAHLHLVISNGCQISCREQLGDKHPLRRLLKPHYAFNAKINHASSIVLFPVNGIAYKTFAFAPSVWPTVLYDSLRAFKYQLFPDFIASKGLTKEELASFPLAVDGLDYWNTVKRYVSQYVDLFYAEESDVSSDNELADYWRAVGSSPSGVTYGLPELTKDNLIDHTTYSIFWVTGGTYCTVL